jgi:hypothetical protein
MLLPVQSPGGVSRLFGSRFPRPGHETGDTITSHQCLYNKAFRSALVVSI